MVCNNCGASIAYGSKFCPACGEAIAVQDTQPPVQQPEYNPGGAYDVPPAYAQPIQPSAKERGKARSRSYAAIASALFVFPTLICFVLDYIRDDALTWSPYSFGIFMCLWMFTVLPAVKPKHPALTVTICFGAITLYLIALSLLDNAALWYTGYTLPIALMLTVSSAVISLLASYKVLKGIHILTAVSIQSGLLLCGIESVFDIQRRGVISLRWSLLTAVAAISAAAICEAVAYAARANSKR